MLEGEIQQRLSTKTGHSLSVGVESSLRAGTSEVRSRVTIRASLEGPCFRQTISSTYLTAVYLLSDHILVLNSVSCLLEIHLILI